MSKKLLASAIRAKLSVVLPKTQHLCIKDLSPKTDQEVRQSSIQWQICVNEAQPVEEDLPS